MIGQALFGERALSMIAAAFDTQEEDERTLKQLQGASDFGSGQLQMVAPFEKDFGRKLEPESQGVARTAAKSHLVLGGIGFGLGILLWIVLFALGMAVIRSSPLLSAIAIIFFLTIAGLLLGGLLTARPDHQTVIQEVKTATEAGKWSIVVHPLSPAQHDAALATLKQRHADTTETL